jgi:hypothetical protein
MNYLEQFTYGEAHKVVQGFGHLRGEYAYKAAMKQLEDRYGANLIVCLFVLVLRTILLQRSCI